MSISRLGLAALVAGLASHKIVLVSEAQDEIQGEQIVDVRLDECCQPPLLAMPDEVPAYRQRHNRNSGVAKARRASKKGKR